MNFTRLPTSVVASLFLFTGAACALDESVGPKDGADAAAGGPSSSAGGSGGSGGQAGGASGSGGGAPASGGSGGASGSGGTGGGGAGGAMDAAPAPAPRDAARPVDAPPAAPPATCMAGDCRPIAGAFDGFLYSHPCGDEGTGFDCLGSMCAGGTSTRTQSFMIKGDPATTYELSFRVRGVVEAKNYSGGRRRAQGLDPSANGGDQWYEGGTAPNSTYNTYELHVTPRVDGAPNDYFLNARDGSGEDHSSWALNYLASIKVKGGGSINFRSFDSNCRQIMNCGPGGGSNMCAAPRVLNLTGAVPPPPANFVQPPKNAQNATGQWLFIDVLDVKAL